MRSSSARWSRIVSRAARSTSTKACAVRVDAAACQGASLCCASCVLSSASGPHSAWRGSGSDRDWPVSWMPMRFASAMHNAQCCVWTN
jgi:hypothetical protein